MDWLCFGSNWALEAAEMNREDIIRMAREAGYSSFGDDWYDDRLERFAALVAAAEREACAKVCEAHGSIARHSVWMAEECAALIRARGQQ